MTTPSEIADLVRRTKPDLDIEERPGHLVLRAPLDDGALRAAWLALRAAVPDYVTAVTITDADVDAILEADEVPPRGQPYRIVVESVEVADQLRLYFSASLKDNAAALTQANNVLLADMAPQETFSTYRSRLQLWTRDPPEAIAPSEPLPDPRAFAGDFTGGAEVPGDIRPWLLRAEPTARGRAYAAWCELAARRLMAALSDRVSSDQGRVAYHFSGPPACTLSPEDADVTALLPRLQAGAAWVFPEARDADTRHLLLAAEWARTHRRGSPHELGDGSLDSAKAAYAAYVKAGSRETLKALAELRKAVIDETQKAAQRAQDLAGAIWKDLAVAAAPFVLKILPDAGKAANQTLAGIMALSAAAFLVFSFSIQVYINKRYFRHQKDARSVWKRALNVALTPAEVESFSETPIRSSIADYRKVRLAVGIVYAALVAALIAFAWANLHAPTVRAPAATAAGSEASQDAPGSAGQTQPVTGGGPADAGKPAPAIPAAVSPKGHDLRAPVPQAAPAPPNPS